MFLSTITDFNLVTKSFSHTFDIIGGIEIDLLDETLLTGFPVLGIITVTIPLLLWKVLFYNDI